MLADRRRRVEITERAIDQAFSDLRDTWGGVRNDYFGLLYLERTFHLDRERACEQVAFGGNDYGVDGVHIDTAARNLYLFQFKYSDSAAQFKPSFSRLISAGMERIFGARDQDQQLNPLLLLLRSWLVEYRAVIDRVFFLFVFTGNPSEAERNQALDKLREDLQDKQFLIDQRFGRSVPMDVQFRSARHVGPLRPPPPPHTHEVELGETVTRAGPNGEIMTIGFISLLDLDRMYRQMNQRFFDRNIRGALPPDKAVNRSVERSLKRIVLEGKEDARVFAFHHNGVTLSAQALTKTDGTHRITEPRLLNGAQTVSTFARFLDANERNQTLVERRDDLHGLRVMCRIITGASPEFVTSVTVNNNRQNPVAPWNLRANDMIQLELQDKFRDDLGIYYARQERAFENLSDEDLDERGITQYKAVELVRLARTFLVSDGEIDKLARFPEVFEDERSYSQVFDTARLRADSRKILLCYKIQFRLPKLAQSIVDKGANKYAYVQKTRNLLWAFLCQAILNDPKLEERADEFGGRLNLEREYVDWLAGLATMRCRLILSDLAADKHYADKVAEGNYSFMRSKAAFKRGMAIAYQRWRWVEKRLVK
jgi:hypothetical protein